MSHRRMPRRSQLLTVGSITAVLALAVTAMFGVFGLFSTQSTALSSGSVVAGSLNTPGTGTAGTNTPTSESISWGASSGLPSFGGYILQRSTTTGTESPIGSGTCSGLITTTSCTDTGLTAGTTYFYRVQAAADQWRSALNTEFSGTTLSADGSGALTTTTTTVNASSTGNTITFTYTAGSGGLNGGAVTLAVPTGWTAPSTTGNDAGFTTATTGTVSVSGQTITVSPVTLASGGTFDIVYGSKASGGTGATAPSTAGAQTWQGQEKSTSGGSLTNITSPSITVNGTAQTVSAELLATATDNTNNGQITTVSNVNGTTGKTLLILAYRAASASGIGISSITGTAISGTATAITGAAQTFTNNSKTAVFAWKATASGNANGTVVVDFGDAKNNKTVIDVVQLTGNDTSTVTAHVATSMDASANTSATTTISTANASNGEIFFVGIAGTATSIATPAGFTALNAPASTVTGSFFKAAAINTAITSTLGASRDWGVIALEVNHG